MRTLVLCLAPAMALALAAPASSAERPADLVLRGGELVTFDDAHPRARALAARDGRIVAVGDDAAVAPFIGPATRVVELGGRAVVPALTDAHAHLVGLGLDRVAVDLRGCTSAEACAERLRGARAVGPWLYGRGWDQNRFADRAFPTHAAIDRVVADRPVWLTRVDGHAGWANAVAMKRAGITRATADPAGGRIIRDASGEPTGVFVDNAMRLVLRAAPPPSAAELEQAILRGQDIVVADGLTAIHDMGIDHDAIAAYQRLAAANKLKLRVYAFGSARAAAKLLTHPPAPAAPDAHFVLRGIKLYADGALGSRGAALLQPYDDDPQNRGLLLTPGAELEALARRALANGWQVGVHAIGDRGNREVLDAYTRAGVTPKARFRIEHAQIVALDDIARFARLGVIASMQPMHALSDGPWAETRLGKARMAGAYAWRRMREAGVALAFGSDFPVEDVDFMAWLRAGIGRGPHNAGQALTLVETLAAFTRGAAYASFQEESRGRIAVGQLADLTVFSTPLATLPDGEPRMTIVGGTVVFEKPAR